MQNISKLTFSVIVCVMAMMGYAADSISVTGGTLFYRIVNNKAEIYNDGARAFSPVTYKGTVKIPSTIRGCSVTRIGDNAFNGCYMTGVLMPASVTAIGNSAFSGCRLSSVTIPSGVTTIGNSAFRGCPLTTGLFIPASVTTIGNGAFRGCSMTSVTMPSGIKSIGDETFYGCASLTSVTIPDGVTSIGSAAFFGCTGLLNVTIPNTVTSIGTWAFYQCRSLTIVTIPDSVTAIAARAFSECKGLTSLTIPDGVTSIGDLAFYWSTSITNITIPASVASVGNMAFGACSSLASVMFMGNAPVCGDDIFTETLDTLRVYVPRGSTGWRGGDSSELPDTWNGRTILYTTLSAEGIEVVFNPNGGMVEPANMRYPIGETYSVLPVPTRRGYAFLGWYTAQVDGTLVTDESIVTKENTELIASWKPVTYTVVYDSNGGTGTMNSQSHTYDEPQGLTDNTFKRIGYKFIGWSLTEQGDARYANGAIVENLSETQDRVVTLYAVWQYFQSREEYGSANGCEWKYMTWLNSEGVEVAANICLKDKSQCPKILRIPSTINGLSVISIGVGAFADCTGITSIEIPSCVDSVKEDSFRGCLPKYVVAKGRYCIDFSSVVELTIPDGCTSIEAGAFKDCTAIKKVTIPSGVTSIGKSAFYGCSSVSKVSISEGLVSIGSYAFDMCSNLRDITIPNSVTTIDSYSFAYCASLRTIQLPNGLTFIGSYAFTGSGLNKISIPLKVNIGQIAKGTFYDCQNLSEVVIKAGISTIGDYAFYNCKNLWYCPKVGDGEIDG